MKPHHLERGSQLRDFILGWQDGIVNVLGIILGIAAATATTKYVLVAGLAAMFAESVSMAAVAYTSMKAKTSHYQKELEREKREIEEVSQMEKKEIRDIYYRKGFRGRLLDQIVRKITSNKKIWLDTMMKDELGLTEEKESPAKSSVIVGFAAVIGSFVPLIPFFFLAINESILVSLVISLIVLFVIGVIKARITIGSWIRSGAEMALIGMGAAIVGYLIGAVLGVALV